MGALYGFVSLFSLGVLLALLSALGFITPSLGIIFTLPLAYLIKKHRAVYIFFATLPRDCLFVARYIVVLIHTKRFERNGSSVVTIFKKQVASKPNAPCFYYEDQVWTYKDVFEYSNRVAHVFQDAGYQHGDVVALFMENKPEFVAIWLGLSQLGCVTALINTNLRKNVLIHSLDVAKPKGIIYSSQLASGILEVADSLANPTEFYEHNDVTQGNDSIKVRALVTLLNSSLKTEPEVKNPAKFKDKLLYIYTSGTTGMPKAANIPHSRYLMATIGAKCMLALTEDDIIYNPLPLYHTAGGILGTGPAIVSGIPIVLRGKFSASAYWPDCIKYNCTVGQYIGEMCRYMLAVPEKPHDKEHRVRLMLGNGMKPAIWPQFVKRFNVQAIRELYGATEGNVNIVNIDNQIGAVGALPSFLALLPTRAALIKLNQETEEPIRNGDGLCIKCKPNEPGMFVGVISSKDTTSEYHGYVDEKASNKKVLRNVFSHGDKAFISGDILVMDEYGYLYFKDRTGDTFRWKGENVATAEVEAVISNNIGLRDATVYGVEIEGQEGRAGMAAIVDPDNILDVSKLALALDNVLPMYARPVFLRTVKKMDLTGTFKLKKVDLQKEGFDPSNIKDDVYFRKGKTYELLTPVLYKKIISGEERV